MFANGGKTSDQELIKGIQKILGVDDSQMEQLLQIGINKYGSLEGIGQALSQATQGLTQNSSPEEVQAAVASVFQTNAESQMFKCGGKLQQLVSKFGKGGNVDCGCNGVKLGQEGFKTSGSGTDPDAGFHTWDIEVTPQKDTIVRYTYPSYNGKAVLTPNGGTVKEWLNGDSFPTVYRDRNWFNRHPRRALLPFSGNLNNAKIMNARELAQNHIPSQQEGGVMLEQMPGNSAGISLTRRQARELSQLNKGYNRAQFQTAMLNAKAALKRQGLRGKELRDRAKEMVSGITPAKPTIVSSPTTPELNGAALLPKNFNDITPIIFPEKKPEIVKVSNNKQKPIKRGVVEVGNVEDSILNSPININSPIGHTTRSGLKTTTLSLDSGKYGIDGIPLGRIYKEYIEEQPHITRTGRDDAGNYYEVSDGMAGIDTNGNYYIRRPLMSSKNQNIVPAGGGNFNWAVFKKGGKIDNLACGKKLSCEGKTKAKEGIKLAKCGKKVKK